MAIFLVSFVCPLVQITQSEVSIMLDPKILNAVVKLSLAKSLLASAGDDLTAFQNTLRSMLDNESIYRHFKCLANIQDDLMSTHWSIGVSEMSLTETNLDLLSDLGQGKNDDNAVNLALELLAKNGEENT